MIVAELEKAIMATLSEGKKPFFVNATAGTTLFGAFDDFHSIADVCEKYRIWMHVDGCLGSSAILSRKHAHLLKGTERANSLTWNPHKTLGVPLQCNNFIYILTGQLNIDIYVLRLIDYFQGERNTEPSEFL